MSKQAIEVIPSIYVGIDPTDSPETILKKHNLIHALKLNVIDLFKFFEEWRKLS